MATLLFFSVLRQCAQFGIQCVEYLIPRQFADALSGWRRFNNVNAKLFTKHLHRDFHYVHQMKYAGSIAAKGQTL